MTDPLSRLSNRIWAFLDPIIAHLYRSGIARADRRRTK